MKKTSKALLLSLCAVLLVTASVLGTVAWLTDQAEVTNTFTVGNVGISLDEAKVNEDGEKLENAERVQENEYKLMPGRTYTKDPTIHVDPNSEDCYLFVKIENGIVGIETDTYGKTVAEQMSNKHWAPIIDGEEDGEETIYVYYQNGKPVVVSAEDDVTIFENFTIGEDVNNLASYADSNIKVTAYAIQADGFENKTAGEIWAAINQD